MDLQELRHRHEGTGAVRYVDSVKILRDGAVFGLRLHQHVVRARAVVEEVDEVRAGRRIECVEHALRRHSECERFRTIEVGDQIRTGENRRIAHLRERLIGARFRKDRFPTLLSVGRPRLFTSSIWIAKPPVDPRPGIAGGLAGSAFTPASSEIRCRAATADRRRSRRCLCVLPAA